MAGFLVMFMQAGFALVETGMCRAKNVAHTMCMNFLVYALSMMGFFVFGFAFMMGGVNGTPAGIAAPLIGGPSSLDLDEHRRSATCSTSPSPASTGESAASADFFSAV